MGQNHGRRLPAKYRQHFRDGAGRPRSAHAVSLTVPSHWSSWKTTSQRSSRLREIAEGHITPAILEEVEQPAPEEFMQPDPTDDLMPMRGISIGD